VEETMPVIRVDRGVSSVSSLHLSPHWVPFKSGG